MNYCYENHYSFTSKWLRLELNRNYARSSKPKLIRAFYLRNSFVRLRFCGSLLQYIEDQAKELCCLQLDQNAAKQVEIWAEIKGRDYRSWSDSYRSSPMLRDKEHGNLAK